MKPLQADVTNDVLAETHRQLLSLEELLTSLANDLLQRIPHLLAALFLLCAFIVGAILSARVIRTAMARRGVERSVNDLAARLTRWSLILVGVVIALAQVGINVTAFVAGLGIVGFTLGFALQDISANLVSGLLLMVQQPFRIGDEIEVAGFSGRVKAIDLRATTVRTFDGNDVLIPNGDVFTSSIVNYSRSPTRRVDIEVGVAYGTDLTTATRVAIEAVSRLEHALKEPAPQARLHSFGESSIDMTVQFWTNAERGTFLGSWHDGIVAIESEFAKAGIDIPFPIRTLHMRREAAE